jgi:hypothetical protein
MKVFLSWSGEKSRAVAETLRDWLPLVIQDVEPFMSEEDIEAGTRWQNRIAEELEGSQFGIICVTRDNQSSRWLNFEAGAIAKEIDRGRVAPLAIDLTPGDVQQPLGLFQVKAMSKAGILAVLESINNVRDAPLPNLAEACDVWWEKLEPKLDAAKSAEPATTDHVRGDRELLEEILSTVRGLQSQPSSTPTGALGNLGASSIARTWANLAEEAMSGPLVTALIRNRLPRAKVATRPGVPNLLFVETPEPVSDDEMTLLRNAASKVGMALIFSLEPPGE